MNFRFIMVTGLILLSPSAVSASDATKESVHNKWDLTQIYKDKDAWKKSADKFESGLVKIDECKGQLGKSAVKLESCLTLFFEQLKTLRRISAYASMLYDENTRVSSSLELKQRAQLLGTKFSQNASFIRPEILSVGKEKIEKYINKNHALKIYKHYLDDILRLAPHTLSQAEEALLADTGLVTGAPSDFYSILANADMQWPTIKLSDGSEVTLSQAGYGKTRTSTNRGDRIKVFNAFWGKWKEYERTFGMALYSQLKRDYFYSKVRKYPNSVSSSIGANNIPEKVYNTLLKETNNNLDTFHRYLKLRARILNIKDLGYYDIYPPLVESDIKFDIEKAKSLTLNAFKPLGDDYTSVVKKGYESRWMDVYPQPGKRSGAYMMGIVYDVHPYVLMNYNDDYDGVSTLAHEWGHAIHSYLSNKHQPFVTARYATFNAEVASTFNEALLLDYMLKQAKTDNEKLFYLGSALEQLRGTFFRQTMFAEFEKTVHNKVEKGEALSGEKLSAIYGELLRRYHGEDKGVMKIDDLYTVEWAFIPHFYMNFYVYQYATSIAASSLLADDVMAKKPGALDRYLTLLKSGGSDYPYELLKKAGVDLATPAPYRSLIKRMNNIMDQIEAILDRRK